MKKLPSAQLRRRIEKGDPYLEIFRDNLINFFWRELVGLVMYLLYPLFWVGKKTIQRAIFSMRTGGSNKAIDCPVRGFLGTKVYDSMGNFTEEYYRVQIVKRLLEVGFPQKYMSFHHRIQIGHKGKNSFIPDLVVRKKSERGFFLVLEVKKNSNKMEEALLYQLNPAVKILNSQYGLYYDGSKRSFCFNHDGSRVQNFNFSNIPTWFHNEWKNS